MFNKEKIYNYLQATTREILLAYTQNRLLEENNQLSEELLTEQSESIVIKAWEIFLTRMGQLRYLHYFKLWQTRQQSLSKVQIITHLKGIISQQVAENQVAPPTTNDLSNTYYSLVQDYLKNTPLNKKELDFMQHHLCGVMQHHSPALLISHWNQQSKHSLTQRSYNKKLRKINRKLKQNSGIVSPWFIR
ncbi:MAG TPA: hypothetical protein DCS93_38205 [Microscillaceae bacterium]|nr:hypothetical protein [Microscillaceae bacterium]